jgi:hypothetical protein
MRRLFFSLLLLPCPVLAASSSDTWTQTTQAAPGGGYYYQDSATSEFCNPNFSCYQQYVVPSIAPPGTSCTEAEGQTCSGSTGLTDTDTVTGLPGGGASGAAGGATATAAGVTASNLSGFGPYVEIAKVLAIVCVPILLIAIGWPILRNLRSGMRMAGGGSDVAPPRLTDKEVRDQVRRERRELMREEREDRAWEKYEDRREERLAKGGNW